MSAEPESDCLVRKALRAYLDAADRGVATDIACGTSLTKAEISQFHAGTRDLTDQKIIAAFSWLLQEGRIGITIIKEAR